MQPGPRTHDRGLATGGNQGHSPPWCPERRAHRPLCRALKDTAASGNTGEKTLPCHGELWQSRLWTVTARDHQTLPDAKAPTGLTRRLAVGI